MLLFTPISIAFQTNQVNAIVQVDPNNYPYRTGPTCANGQCTADRWAFVQRECTSYVAWRINVDRGADTETGPFFFHNYLFSPIEQDINRRFSNAHLWDDRVRIEKAGDPNIGFSVDNIPAPGAVAVWEINTAKYMPVGHVAYVESVFSDGRIKVSEYNSKGDGMYGERILSGSDLPDHYIHMNARITTAGSLEGRIYNTQGLINPRQTLVTATTPNGDFYSSRSYFGAYKFDKLPTGLVHISATDGISTTSIGNMFIPAYSTRYYNIILNNQCLVAPSAQVDSKNTFSLISTVQAQSACSIIPFIPEATSPPPVGEPVCTTPPSSSVNVTGATQGNNGWWRSSTQVSFYASAPCGPDNLKTYYKINNGSQQQYSGPFTINQEGIHNITYYSIDGLGNTESTKSVQVKIDWTPPVTSGNATGPRDTNGIFRDNVTAGLSSTDNLSGVESQQRSMDGGTNWITMNGSNNTFQITGNGVSRFVFRATDNAGNLELFKDSGPIIINKYVIYSNGTADSLRFTNTTGVNISGDIYSGGTTTFDGNTGGIFGTTFKTVGTSNLIKNTNTNIQVPSIVTGVSSVPMLSYPLSLYKSLATVVFPSDLYLDSVSSQLKGILYVEGNVKMVDVGLSGPVSIVATGSINDVTTDSTFQTGDPNNGVLLYAGTNIEVNSTGNRNLGLMYAPNGVVKIRATGLTLKGSLVGKEVELYGATNFNLSYNAAFASSTHALPLVAMGLNIPTTVAPAVPSVPALSKPANSATGISNTRPKISWSSSTGAVGYNLQVSTSSTFSTLTYNGSVLSTGVSSMSLSKGTKYYWRVRSINQGGMSVWSTVRSFTTQN